MISLIKSCSEKTHLLQIHAQLVLTSLVADPSVSLEFISRSALRDLTYSRKFFTQIQRPFFLHYNAMIRAYSMSDSAMEGIAMYRDMRRRGLEANAFSLMFAVKCCVKASDLTFGIQAHSSVVRDGHGSDGPLVTTLVELYSRRGSFAAARKLFDEMPRRDTVAWNVLVSCCLRNKLTRDALALFDVMRAEKKTHRRCSEPDKVTCLLVLQACASLSALEFGEKIHQYASDRGFADRTELRNALVLMYSRCGALEKAYEVFEGTREKTVASWAVMISGLAKNGRGTEAIDAFRTMISTGLVPDERTFTAVLSACSHSGLVDEGISVFDRMTAEFGVEPNIHHYGCLVDLLGRAGLLDRAYRVASSMEIEPDPEIWRTLLGACRIHGRGDLGERVVGHLIELRAQEAGDYVLLSNIYSSAGKWDKVAGIQKLLKENDIQTTPGCSTIELGGSVHEFVADDVSHPRSDEIYATLSEMNGQLKIGGYVVEMSSESHKLGDREKESVLSYHGEKLAMAFGLLSTPPGTAIRVSKNLRTCVDCHNFAKALSRVYDREVVVRDRARFHHFRQGRCSCNDYW